MTEVGLRQRPKEKNMNIRTNQKHAGFTLVELAVVIVIIGILAAFAVPKFRQAVERSKAGEAFNYLSAIRDAQERYHSRQSIYATNLAALDINMPTPKYFDTGTVDATALETAWSLTLTRSGASGGYGSYTVSFTQDGYDATIGSNVINNEINPMGTML